MPRSEAIKILFSIYDIFCWRSLNARSKCVPNQIDKQQSVFIDRFIDQIYPVRQARCIKECRECFLWLPPSANWPQNPFHMYTLYYIFFHHVWDSVRRMEIILRWTNSTWCGLFTMGSSEQGPHCVILQVLSYV